MASNTNVNSKRFVFRSSKKVTKAYFVATDRSASNVSSKSLPPRTPVSTDTPPSEAIPARRVVVVRNTKNSQTHQGPIDLPDFGESHSAKIPPVITDGVSVLFLDNIFHSV
jgi:hypothetical protein